MHGFEYFSGAMLLWIAFAIALSGVLHGALGFGFPFIATPLIAMASDMRTAVITILLPTIATIIATAATAGPLRPVLARFWMMPIYAMAGSFAGTWLFVAAPDAPYSLMLVCIIVIYLNVDRLARGDWPFVRKHEKAFAPLAGVVGGIFEGTVNVAVPPLIFFYLALGLAPAMVVQGLSICFLVGKITQFSVLTVRGGVTAGQWLATLPFALVALAAFFTGVRIRNRIDAQTYRVWVKRALMVIAVVLTVQYFYQNR